MEQISTWINNSNGWLISLFSVILGALITGFLAKRKEILMKIADRKSKYYADYVYALFEFGNPYIRFDEEVSRKINKDYYYYKNMIILFGSDEVIKKLANCEEKGISISDAGDPNYIELIKAMKKDIKNPKLIKSLWRLKSKKIMLDKHIDQILFKYKQKH